jgi:hypothetical protein
MIDDTEDLRRAMIAARHLKPVQLKGDPFIKYWTTEQLRQEFEVLGFQAPYVVVRRMADGVKGSLEFQHSPRIYFNWREDKP